MVFGCMATTLAILMHSEMLEGNVLFQIRRSYGRGRCCLAAACSDSNLSMELT